MPLTKRKRRMLLGLAMMTFGGTILCLLGYKRISRTLQKWKLLRESIVFEVPDVDIKAPVLDGIGQDVLSVAAGHFPNTGGLGTGNYCIAGHNSTIYACIFNNLPKVTVGMRMYLYDNDEGRTCYTYEVTEHLVIEKEDVWVLDETEEPRLTVITCTDDGTQRHAVIGRLVAD